MNDDTYTHVRSTPQLLRLSSIPQMLMQQHNIHASGVTQERVFLDQTHISGLKTSNESVAFTVGLNRPVPRIELPRKFSALSNSTSYPRSTGKEKERKKERKR